MTMLTDFKKEKNSEAELRVELQAEDLKRSIQKAEQELAATAVLDGFRPGKVPLDVLRKKIGDEKILEIAMELAVKDSFQQAIKKEKADVISSFDLKVIENTAQRLSYRVKLLLFPEVTLGAYRGFGISLPFSEIKEEEIQEAISRILKSRANYRESDKPAQKGQRLEIDFEVTDNGKVVEGGKSESHPLLLGGGFFMPGFEEQLEGMKKGETKLFSLQIPEDYYQKNIAGKKLDFSVTLKSVQAEILPELTDDFAKTLGEFSSVEKLKEGIIQGLKREKETKARERARLEILNKISEETEMDVPSRMIEEQLDILLSNFDESLHGRGLELSLYLAQIKKTQEELRQEWRERAEKQVRQGLIMRAISKAEGITVSEEEVEEAVTRLLSRYAGLEEERNKLDVEAMKKSARESLLNEKVWVYLEKINS